MLFQEPGNEVKSEAREAVSVGNHNFLDISAHNGVQ